MQNYPFLKGSGTALVTPFDQTGNIDYPAFEKLINHNIAGGMEYLVIQGTTGETATLSKEERVASFEFAHKIIANRVPLVIGIGGNNTLELAKEFGWFDLSKAAAVLSASPAYNKPSQEGIYQHYKYLASISPKPIILYNVPGRTASNMAVDTTLRIAKDFKNIIAVKEASGNLGQVMKIIQNKPDGFYVISGDDALTIPIIAIGGDGLISVVSNAYPKETSDMVRFALQNKMADAQKLHYQLLNLIDLLFEENNPAGIKAVLALKNICQNQLRLPLVKVSDPLQKKIHSSIW